MNPFQKRMFTPGYKIVHGGLQIVRTEKMQFEAAHWALYMHKFDLEAIRKDESVSPEVYELAEKVKHLLDMEKPPTLSAYFEKFKSYNQILFTRERVQTLRKEDGPHPVKFIRKQHRLYDKVELYEYEVKLTPGYKIPNSEVILLTPQGMEFDESKAIKGEVVECNKDTQIVRFIPFDNPQLPGGIFTIRFEPSSFFCHARNHILNLFWKDNLCNELYTELNFWLNPQPISDLLSKEEFLEKRQQLMDTIPFSPAIGFNREQRKAITSIVYARNLLKVCNQNTVLLPYLVHGPRDTGKTATLVEAVRLLMIQQSAGGYPVYNRVLVCTPSEELADHFATELLQTNVNTRELLRIHGLMRPIDEVSDELIAISLIDQGDVFGIPEELRQYRVIICTVTVSSYLVLTNMMSGFFSHIIVDGAGMASELNTLIPILGLAHKETKILLAGFPQPLGPLEKIAYFRDNNFTKSMLERIMEIEFYVNDPRTATFLPPIHSNRQQEESGENRDWNNGNTGAGETEALSENMVEMNEEETDEIQNALSAPLLGGSSQSDF